MASTFESVTRKALEALEAGETVALCTVVQSKGSTPRHEGARMVVWPDRRLYGTVGGGALEEEVVKHALEAMETSKAHLGRYVFSTNPEDRNSLGLCGGANDVFIEVLKPRPHILILGGGHIGRELAHMAARLEMGVTVLDDRPEFIQPDDFPAEASLILAEYDAETETLAPLPATLTPNMYAVLATWGWDGPAMQQLFPSPIPYIGLVASRTKARVLLERFAADISPERIDASFHSPIGLDIGAETPAEIALAILAEIVAFANRRTGESLKDMPREPKRSAKPAAS